MSSMGPYTTDITVGLVVVLGQYRHRGIPYIVVVIGVVYFMLICVYGTFVTARLRAREK